MNKAKKRVNKAFRGIYGRALTRTRTPRDEDTITDNYIGAGWLLSQMDIAAGIRAHNYVGDRTVTVGLDAMSFQKPVFVGNLVSIYTEVVRQGRSSVDIRVESWAKKGKVREKVTEGLFTFVAIDGNHRPMEIRQQPKKDKKGKLPPPMFFARPPHQHTPASNAPSETKRPRLVVVPRQRDKNYLGDIFGGWVLDHMDVACALEVERHVGPGLRPATVGIEAMSFDRPVFAGDELGFYTKVVKTGNKSISVKVETWATRHENGRQEKVTAGVFTYVIVGADRKTVPVQPKL